MAIWFVISVANSKRSQAVEEAKAMGLTLTTVFQEVELLSQPQSLRQFHLHKIKEMELETLTTAFNYDFIGKMDTHGKRLQKKPGGACNVLDAINFP